MKRLWNFAFTACVLLSLLLSTSCQFEQDVIALEESKAELLLVDIQNDHTFLDYMDARQTFFNHLGEKKIDLFSIHNELKRHNIQDWCLADPSILEGYKGATLFIESICKMNEEKRELRKSFDLKMMSEEQIVELFTVKQAAQLDNEAENRGSDCLALFQAHWGFADAMIEFAGDDEMLLASAEAKQNEAVGMYDRCCEEDGNSGCP